VADLSNSDSLDRIFGTCLNPRCTTAWQFEQVRFSSNEDRSSLNGGHASVPISSNFANRGSLRIVSPLSKRWQRPFFTEEVQPLTRQRIESFGNLPRMRPSPIFHRPSPHRCHAKRRCRCIEQAYHRDNRFGKTVGCLCHDFQTRACSVHHGGLFRSSNGDQPGTREPVFRMTNFCWVTTGRAACTR